MGYSTTNDFFVFFSSIFLFLDCLACKAIDLQFSEQYQLSSLWYISMPPLDLIFQHIYNETILHLDMNFHYHKKSYYQKMVVYKTIKCGIFLFLFFLWFFFSILLIVELSSLKFLTFYHLC